MSTASRSTNALGLLALALVPVVVLLELFRGSVLLAFSGNHGLDLGDLVVVPLVLLAGWLLRNGRLHARIVTLVLAAQRRGRDPMAIGLLTTGTGLVLVHLLRGIDAADAVPRVSVVPVVLVVVGALVTAGALSVPGAARATFGVPFLAALGALSLGLLLDGINGPAGFVMGPTLLAAVCAFGFRHRKGWACWLMLFVTALLIPVDIAALVSVHFLARDRELDGGGMVRTGSLGLVLLALGIIRWADARSQSGAHIQVTESDTRDDLCAR